MKRFTAAEAQSRFAEFLEELSAGRPVTVELADREVVVRAHADADFDAASDEGEKLDYSAAISDDFAATAHRWTWEFTENGLELVDSFATEEALAEGVRRAARWFS